MKTFLSRDGFFIFPEIDLSRHLNLLVDNHKWSNRNFLKIIILKFFFPFFLEMDFYFPRDRLFPPLNLVPSKRSGSSSPLSDWEFWRGKLIFWLCKGNYLYIIPIEKSDPNHPGKPYIPPFRAMPIYGNNTFQKGASLTDLVCDNLKSKDASAHLKSSETLCAQFWCQRPSTFEPSYSKLFRGSPKIDLMSKV